MQIKGEVRKDMALERVLLENVQGDTSLVGSCVVIRVVGCVLPPSSWSPPK